MIAPARSRSSTSQRGERRIVEPEPRLRKLPITRHALEVRRHVVHGIDPPVEQREHEHHLGDVARVLRRDRARRRRGASARWRSAPRASANGRAVARDHDRGDRGARWRQAPRAPPRCTGWRPPPGQTKPMPFSHSASPEMRMRWRGSKNMSASMSWPGRGVRLPLEAAALEASRPRAIVSSKWNGSARLVELRHPHALRRPRHARASPRPRGW